MSASRSATIRVGFDGDQARAGLERLGNDGNRALDRLRGAAAATEQSANLAGQGLAGLGQAMGPAIAQARDFEGRLNLVKVGLAALGPMGAAAGSAIGVVATAWAASRVQADNFRESMERQSAALRVVEEDGRRYRDGLAAEARQVRELTQYYGTLSEARQSQEMRQLRRDQTDLVSTQERLQRDALGSTAGLSTQFRQQLADVDRQAANDYGRGSEAYGLIVSNPDLQRIREFVAVVEGFRETGDVSREALARLYQQMIGLAEGSDVVSRRIRAQAEAVEGLTGRARDAEAAQAQLAARAAALGVNIDGAATAAERLNRQMASLSSYDARVTAGLDQEITNMRMQLAAAHVGAGRLREIQEEIGRDARLERMVADRAAELTRLGVSGEAATASLATFREETGRNLDRLGAMGNRLRELQDGFSRAGRGAAEASREFEALRRHTSGLLVANESEQRVVGEIAQQIRGTILDPEVRRRAAEVAAREAERQQDAADRFSERWGDRIASETTRGLFEGAKNGETALQRVGNAFRNILMSSVSAALSRQVFQPIVSNVASSFSTVLGGNVSGAAGVAGPSAAGANQAMTLAGNLGSAQTVMRGLGGFNPGSYMSGDALFNTGFTRVDGLLNTPLFEGANAGLQGPTASGAALGSSGYSIGSLGAGALGIAGGLYGAYSGYEKGGIGGGLQMAGGGLTAGLSAAAMASMTVPVYGWIAAAILSIAGAMLPGEKASGRGQSTFVNVDSNSTGYAGLGGDRYSQDNRNSATSAAEQIAALARQVGEKLGGAQFGSHVAVGVTSGRGNGAGDLYLDVAGRKAQFSNDEAGSKQLAETAARFVVQQFREEGRASGDYASILNASGDSVEKLSENLDWYERIYKTFDDSVPKVTAYAQSIAALGEQFQPAIDKAAELGLNIDKMTAAREREISKLQEARDAQVRNIDLGLSARLARVRGDGLGADLIGFDAGAAVEIRELREGLEQMGLAAVDVGYRITTAEQLLAEERLAIQRGYAEQAAQQAQQQAEQAAQVARQTAEAQINAARGVLDWLNGEALGASSGLSPTARLREAERQYNAALASGDSGALTNSASALLDATGGVYSTASSTYQERRGFIRQQVGNAGLRDAQAGGDGAIVAALQQMVALQAQQNAALVATVNSMTEELRRANDLKAIAA